MSKNSRKDSFNNDLDDYFNEIETEESKEILEIIKVLENKDFSKISNKEEVFNRTLKNINKYKGENTVKKSNNFKHPITKVASLALICVLSIFLMQTSFAQDLAEKIIKTISLKHIIVTEEEFLEIESYPVPDKLKGKIFDKDGNPIKEFSKANPGNPYTANGEKIADFDPETGEIITVSESEKQRKEQTLIVENSNELNNYTCFNVILPSYLPEGYKFDRAEFYKDENGIVENTKCVTLYFNNEKTGKHIYVSQRFADEETGYAISTDSKIEQVEINGIDAIIIGGRSIHWETNDVIYILNGMEEVIESELIKIAESIK